MVAGEVKHCRNPSRLLLPRMGNVYVRTDDVGKAAMGLLVMMCKCHVMFE